MQEFLSLHGAELIIVLIIVLIVVGALWFVRSGARRL